MNRYAVLVFLTIFVLLLASYGLALRYSQASFVFGLAAAALAPIAIHKIESTSVATSALVGLTIFASFPVKKLFQIDGFVTGIAVSLAVGASLWVIGAGWKRDWKSKP